MAIIVGDTIRVQVVFRDWSSDGDLIDPYQEEVFVSIEDDDGVIQLDTEDNPIQDVLATKESFGVYYYDWTPTAHGEFYVEFTATFDDNSVHVVRERFVVLEVVGPSLSGQILGEDEEILFLTSLTPLYIDPEEVSSFFTEAGNVETMELIHRYSTEVAKMLNLDPDDPDVELPFLALEYIRAAVLCGLSRIYDYGAGGQESSLTLGDLSIVSRSYPRATITRANAVNFCELAAALRAELMRREAPMKAVVKGTKFRDPMPKRYLRSQYHGNDRSRRIQ